MRPALALLAFIGVLFFPPWVPIICMVLLSLRYRAWEVLLIAAFADFVWLPGSFFGSWPLFMIIGIVCVWGFEPLRARFLSSKAEF